MFPAFTEQSARVRSALDRAMRRAMSQRDELLAQIPRQAIHEGRDFAFQRPSEQAETVKMVDMQASFVLDLFRVPDMTANQLIEQIDAVIDEMVRQQGRHMISVLEAGVTTIKRGTDESVSDTHLRVLEGMLMPFDTHGNPHFPTLVMGPEAAETARPVLERARQDPDYQARLQKIITMKREEWRDHEASRRLVD